MFSLSHSQTLSRSLLLPLSVHPFPPPSTPSYPPSFADKVTVTLLNQVMYQKRLKLETVKEELTRVVQVLSLALSLPLSLRPPLSHTQSLSLSLSLSLFLSISSPPLSRQAVQMLFLSRSWSPWIVLGAILWALIAKMTESSRFDFLPRFEQPCVAPAVERIRRIEDSQGKIMAVAFR